MKLFHLVLVAALFGLSACQKQETVQVSDTSQNALDWAGTYEGTLPCADCEGIKTALTLENPDKFVLSEDYLGKGGQPFIENGTFSWDEAGSVITLDTKSNGRKFKIGEGQIWHLDLEGNVIAGDLAKNYILNKKQ